MPPTPLSVSGDAVVTPLSVSGDAGIYSKTYIHEDCMKPHCEGFCKGFGCSGHGLIRCMHFAWTGVSRPPRGFIRLCDLGPWPGGPGRCFRQVVSLPSRGDAGKCEWESFGGIGPLAVQSITNGSGVTNGVEQGVIIRVVYVSVFIVCLMPWSFFSPCMWQCYSRRLC